MKERNHAFDLLCGICIVRMVTLHIMTMCGKNDASWWVEIMYWSYFFMSFFFFKAGYFNKGVSGATWPYLKDRVRRLLVPWATCGLLGNAVYFAFLPRMIARYNKPIEPIEWSHLWDTSSHYGNAPTWFLFSFFMAYMVAHFLEKVPRLHWAVVVFPLVGVWLWQQGNPLWFSLNNVFMGVFFFYVGRLWAWLIRHAGRRTMFVVSFVLLVAFVACNLLWHGSYTMSNNTFKGSPWAGLIGVSLALTGIAGVLLTLRVPRIPVINFIGEHSMVFFLLHYPMLYVYKFFHLSFGRSIYHHLDEVFILVPVIFGLCAWLVPYFEAVPWLSGRPRAKTIQAEPETSSSA
ncbi:MAG: acyltransferase [Bacteroidaceae bacterium]|nr:acyltransferase [Bacteroidaceae bacterium]